MRKTGRQPLLFPKLSDTLCPDCYFCGCCPALVTPPGLGPVGSGGSRRCDIAQLEEVFTLLCFEAQPPPGPSNGHASSTDSSDGGRGDADIDPDGMNGAKGSNRKNRRKQQSGRSAANEGGGAALQDFMPKPRQPLSPAMQRLWDSLAPLFEIGELYRLHTS